VVSSEPRWHPDAVEDAVAARDWYAERSPFAARGFLLALDSAIAAVMEAPSRWPERSHGCRQYLFQSNYPYWLVYRLSPEVEIVAVAHQRRKPEFWLGR
jgi:plasmid stabilization system protein ParE